MDYDKTIMDTEGNNHLVKQEIKQEEPETTDWYYHPAMLMCILKEEEEPDSK
jgi:hypothetical protein